MRTFSRETIEYARSRGIADPEANLPLICDGCSGGLSWLYALGGKAVSCEECCNRHDIDYQLGGTRQDRADADARLYQCASQPGGWKRLRAAAMWVTVRIFGWWYWERGGEQQNF